MNDLMSSNPDLICCHLEYPGLEFAKDKSNNTTLMHALKYSSHETVNETI